jgi:hypothetical protein
MKGDLSQAALASTWNSGATDAEVVSTALELLERPYDVKR